MRFDVITLFPDMFSILRDLGISGRAHKQTLWSLKTWNPRDFTHDAHRTVDDRPYGGGPGMVMLADPLEQAVTAVLQDRASNGLAVMGDASEPHLALANRQQQDGTPVMLMSPTGKRFDQRMAQSLAEGQGAILICGRYEGIDQRVIDDTATRARVRLVSLGDYVLNGGEVASMAMIEAIGRLIPGMVGNPESLVEESHEDGLLEYPSYTKPSSWRGLDVPPVLLSGNHAAIAAWRREQQVERTRRIRPDLLP